MRTAAVYGRQSSGKEKSIAEQIGLCSADAAGEGLAVEVVYQDRTSASRYRRVDRAEWARVVAAVKARAFDVLVLWSSSRGDRDLTSWSGLLDACRESGVLIRVTDDARTYDVRRSGDWQSLAQQGVGNAVDSDKISAGVKRGQAGAAAQGRPSHGRAPYGYIRKYDPATGKLAGQEPDPASAPVVKEIIERVAMSEPISAIVADLQSRDVPRPEKGRWHRRRIRDIALNVAYVGRRVHSGTEHPGAWPALVEPAVFHAAVRVLRDPARITTRPGGQKHLLSYLATCGECGNDLYAARGRYACLDGCVTISQSPTDHLVIDAILKRLGKPDIYTALRKAGDDADRDAAAAWAELDGLKTSLNGWRRSAAKGDTTAESLAVIEADLTVQIRAAQLRADTASIPPALREVLEPGVDIVQRWEALTLPAKRAVIRTLARVSVRPASLPGSHTWERERVVILPAR